MKISYSKFIIYLLSLFLFIIFFFILKNYLFKKPTEIINFVDSKIHENFEIEIANNLNDINNYLKEYLFIESYLLKRQNNNLNIQITIKESFALNKKTNEVIFYDNTTAPVKYFKSNYLKTINLLDISENSIHINNHLIENYKTLSSLFNIDQIEYIDERRYNLVLSDGKIVMLPKVIDSKLLYFIKNNIDLIEKSTNYKQYLDLRNFHNKTIRLK